MKKKIIATIMALTLICTLFAACKNNHIETELEKALKLENFLNYTLSIVAETRYADTEVKYNDTTIVLKVDGQKEYIFGTTFQQFEDEAVEAENEIFVEFIEDYVYLRNSLNGEWSEWQKLEAGTNTYKAFWESWSMQSLYLPVKALSPQDFSDNGNGLYKMKESAKQLFCSKFAGEYLAGGWAEGFAIIDTLEFEIKVVDGKIKYINISLVNGDYIQHFSTTVSNYGTTNVTLPTIG